MLEIGIKIPESVSTEACAILGVRGSGKTNTATVIVEELLAAGCQVAVMDPIDVWWGIGSPADGTDRSAQGILILGGAHGDMPIGKDDGAIVADFLIESGISAVVCTADLETDSARRHFTADFCSRLYSAKRGQAIRRPFTLVLEEAHLFVPQMVDAGTARMVGAIQKIVRQGRVLGFGCMMIDQRAASVNKNVLTQIELLVAHKTNSPQDRKALEDWIDANDPGGMKKTFLESLAKLERGEAWVWCPSLSLFHRTKIRPRRTFDSSATPKIGEEAAEPGARAPVDLDGLKARLSATIEKARTEDPEVLQAKIAELENELETMRKAGSAMSEDAIREMTEKIRLEGFEAGRAEALRVIRERKDRIVGLLNDLLPALAQLTGDDDWERTAQRASDDYDAKVGINQEGRSPQRIPSPPRPVVAREGGSSLGACETKLLAVLATFRDGLTAQQLSIISCYSVTSSSFANALSKLRTAGLIAGGRDWLKITPEGVRAAGKFDPLPRGKALVDFWKTKLSLCERTLLDCLVHVHPKGLPKATLAERSGYSVTSSSFANAISKLRTLQLAEGKNEVKASAALFE